MENTAAALLDEPDAFVDAVFRMRAEFLEMPGLVVTIPQAARLWCLDVELCAAVLSALEEARFLVRTRNASFARAS